MQSQTADIKEAKKGFIKAMVMVAIAVIYGIIPFDLIPDITPFVGYLDDIPLLVTTALYAGYRYHKLKKIEREKTV